MKCIVFFMAFFLVGCAALTEGTRLEEQSSSTWNVIETAYGGYRFQHKCNGDSRVTLYVEKTLEREGKQYFIFFIIPIHSAKSFDKSYSGIKIVTQGGRKECARSDVTLTIREQILSPNKVVKGNRNSSRCEYIWKPEIEERGSFSISFGSGWQCAIPPIEFKYEKGTSYDYQPLGV